MNNKSIFKKMAAVFLAFAVVFAMMPLAMISASAENYEIDFLKITMNKPKVGDVITTDSVKVQTEHCAVNRQVLDDIYQCLDIEWYDLTAAKKVKTGSDKFLLGHTYELRIPVASDAERGTSKPSRAQYWFKTKASGSAKDIKGNWYKLYSPDVEVDINGDDAICENDDGYDRNGQYCNRVAVKYQVKMTEEIMSVNVALDEPEAGRTPDFTPVIADDQNYSAYTPSDFTGYINGVYWWDNTDKKSLNESSKFVEGHDYQVTVALKADKDYVFNGVGSFTTPISYINITGADASRYKGSDEGEIVLITANYTDCPLMLVKNVAIKNLLEPLPGRVPDYNVVFGGDTGYGAGSNSSFNNGVSWYDETDGRFLALDGSEKFVEGHSYECMLLVKANDGYEFYSSSDELTVYANVTINGEPAQAGAFGGGSVAKRMLVTKHMGKCETHVITSVSVSRVSEPVPGDMPSYYAVSDNPNQYDIFTDFATESLSYAKDGMAWYDNTDSRYLTPDVDTFISGHTYTCHVYLLPQTGFKFPSETDSSGVMSIPGKINGRKADYVRNNIGRLMSTGGVDVNYKFTPDDTPRLTTYTVEDVVIPRPNRNPEYTATPGKHTELGNDSNVNNMFGYHNGIMWYDDTAKRRMEPEDTFIEGNSYHVEITLKATDGCIFNVGTDGTSKLVGTVNGRTVTGFADVGPEEERQNYIRCLLKLGVCEREPAVPSNILSRIEVINVTEPFAEFTPDFTAAVATQGVYVETEYNNEKYHDGVAWLDMTEYHYMTTDEMFIAGHVYQIEVAVTTDEGYEFYVSNSSNSGIYSFINGDLASSLALPEHDSKYYRYVYGDFGKCPGSYEDIEYDIHTENGRASMNGYVINKAKMNDIVTVTCNSDVADQFDHWECSDPNVQIEDIYAVQTTFIMPDKDVSLYAILSGDEPVPVYNITVIGGIALDGENNIITSSPIYETVRILWNAPETKKFDHWEADTNSIEIDDIHSSETTFVMPKRDVTITAVDYDDSADPEYSIMVNDGAAFDSDGDEITSAKAGETIRIKWVPSTMDAKFIHWEVNDGFVELSDASSHNTTFVMPENNVAVSAIEATAYYLNIYGGKAYDEANYECIFFAEGETVRIEYEETPGNEFVTWDCDSSDVVFDNKDAPSASFKMPAHDVYLEAKTETSSFKPDHNITVIGGKAFDESNNEITYAAPNAKVKIVWTAHEGASFERWDCEPETLSLDDKTSPETTFIMIDKDVEITAVDSSTTPEFCSVIFAAGGDSDEKYEESVEKNSQFTLPECMLTAPKGKEFDNWSVGKPGDKITVSSDMTITAVWKSTSVTDTDTDTEITLDKAGCTVTAPKADESPDFTPVSNEPEKYAVSVDCWYLNDGSTFPDVTSSDKFVSGNTYCVRIKFTPETGYTFSDSAEFSINGSKAQKVGYEMYELKFTLPEGGMSGIYGDVDKDGEITANDALMILRNSTSLQDFTAEQLIIADVDGDGTITANDALCVLRYSVGLGGEDKTGKPIVS